MTCDTGVLTYKISISQSPCLRRRTTYTADSRTNANDNVWIQHEIIQHDLKANTYGST